MQVVTILGMQQFIVGAAALQAERLASIVDHKKFSHWEQALANFAVGIAGYATLDTVLKVSNIVVLPNRLAQASIILLMGPSITLGALKLLKVDHRNRSYQVIKNMHLHMDQIGSLVALVSQAILLYRGASSSKKTWLTIAAIIMGFAAARASLHYTQPLE